MSDNLISNGDFQANTLQPWVSQGVSIKERTPEGGTRSAWFHSNAANPFLLQTVEVKPQESLQLSLTIAKQHDAANTSISVSVVYYRADFTFISYGLTKLIVTKELPTTSADTDTWLTLTEQIGEVPADARKASILINRLPAKSAADVYVKQVYLSRSHQHAVPLDEVSVRYTGMPLVNQEAITYACVVNSFADTVSVVNVNHRSVDKVIEVGGDPTRLVVTPDLQRILVSNFSGNSICVLDAKSWRVIETIPVGYGPTDIVIHPTGQFAYVCNSFSHTISVINLETYTVMDTINLYGNALAISPDGCRLYVAQDMQLALAVVDLPTHKKKESVKLGKIPLGIALSPDGNTLYIANGEPADTITVLSIPDNYSERMIQVGPSPTGIAISPDGGKAFVAVPGSALVAVLDLQQGIVAAMIRLDLLPEKITVTEDGAYAFVSSLQTNQIAAIDVCANSLLFTFPIDHGPDGIVTIQRKLSDRD